MRSIFKTFELRSEKNKPDGDDAVAADDDDAINDGPDVMMLSMMMMDLMMGTDNFDILKVQVVERSTEVVQLGPPWNFKFKDVFVFRLILKTYFLVFLFSAAQDNIMEVVAELSPTSFFCFFLFLFFAFCLLL